jgi:hypothetical protein
MIDWHDSSCGKWEGKDLFGEPLAFPCDCGFPELVAGAVAEAIDAERKRIIAAIHISRSSMPTFAHVDSYGLGQVLKGKPWPEDR